MSKILLTAVLLLALMCGCNLINKTTDAPTAPAGPGISGTLAGTEIWNSTTSIYHITGDVTITGNVTWGPGAHVVADAGCVVNVAQGGTLTVLQDVLAEFGDNAYIQVGYNGAGTFIATGIAGDPARFTTKTAGSKWGYNSNEKGGILLYSNATNLCVIRNCIIDNATAGIYVQNSGTEISGTVIRNCATYGVKFITPAAPDTVNAFANDTITGNGGRPVIIGANEVRTLTGTGSFSGNTEDYIEVSGAASVTRTGTWKKHNVPYAVMDNVSIGGTSGPVITIEAGAILKFDLGSYIEVGYNGSGTLIASGTSGNPVRFTTLSAGTKWGYNSGEKGGLLFYPNATGLCVVKNCVIDNATAGIYVQNTGTEISGTVVRDCETYGIQFVTPASPDTVDAFLNDTLTGNGGRPLIIGANELRTLTGTGSFSGNGDDHIEVSGAGTVNRTGTWKKHNVPYAVIDHIRIGATAGAAITVQAGCIFKLALGVYVEVGYNGSGTFMANGTALDSIVFTNLGTGVKWGYGSGDNGGIMFYSGATLLSSLTYCRIEEVTTGVYSQKAVTIQNNRIQNCDVYGVFFSTTGLSGSTSANTFSGNGTGDINQM